MIKKISVFLLFLTCFCSHIYSDNLSVKKSSYDDAIEYIHNRDYENAITILQDLVYSAPENIELLLRLGNVYLKIEDYTNAKKFFKKILDLDPINPAAQKGLWEIEYDMNWRDESIKDTILKKIDGFYSQHKHTLSGLIAAFCGYYLLEEKKKTDAILIEIEKYSDFIPFPCLENDLYKKILEETNPHKKAEYCKIFVHYFPEFEEIDSLWGIYLRLYAHQLKNKNRFLQLSNDWIDSRQTFRAYYFSAYYLLHNKWDIKKSIDYFKKSLEIIANPSDKDRLYGQTESDFNRSLRLFKEKIYAQLAYIHFLGKKHNLAIENIIQANEYPHFDHEIHLISGLVYAKEKMTEQALFHFVQLHILTQSDYFKELVNNLLKKIGFSGTLKEYARTFYANIPQFLDITSSVGLNNINGRRFAWGDYNNDGWQDLLIDGRTLLKNEKGTFINVSKEAFNDIELNGNGGIWGDFNNDGHLDFYMTSSGKNKTGLFLKNNGDGHFANITASICKSPCFYPTEGASWIDTDADGFIDLYLTNYEKPERLSKGTPDLLYENVSGKQFIIANDNVQGSSLENMCGRGVTVSDFDNDGDSDLYIANYRLDPNFLLINDENGIFQNQATSSLSEGRNFKGLFGHSIGAEAGDYNNDGRMDLFVANLAHPRNIGYSDKSMLLKNISSKSVLFENVFETSGIQYDETHSDPSWGDFDNDGDLDLFISSTYPHRKSHLYTNENEKFQDITWLSGISVDNGWGSACADYDRDGDLDLVVANQHGITLYQNQGNVNNWIILNLVGAKSNRSSIGARATINLDNKVLIREVQGGKGTGNQHSLPLEFGLGNWSKPVTVTITWPSGIKQTVRRLTINKYHTIQEPV
ncbi:FG-GAP-like repeat-containing protein [Chlamydiota bacterium]